MVTSASLASAQSDNNLYTRRLRRKQAFSNHSTSNICPPDPVQPVTEALDAPINAIRQSNRKAVIIHNVLYQDDSLSDSGTCRTGALSGRFNFKVGGRKLRKKSLLHLSAEMLEPGRGIPQPLSPNYLKEEEASREATLLRMSRLSTSRPTARKMQMQNREAGQNAQKRGHAARSAHICAVISSHPVMVRKAVSTAQGSNVITVDAGDISPAIVQAGHPRRKRRAQAQKRIKFKPILESTEEKFEYPYSGHISVAGGQAYSTSRESVGPAQSGGVAVVESDESTTGKFSHLERERDSYVEKCETLERLLDTVCRNRDTLKRELESTNRRRESLENEVVDLRKRVQTLGTEAAVQHAKLADEISRRRLREVDISQLRDENQRLKSRGEAVAVVARSVESDRHLILNGSLPDTVDDNYQPHKEDFRHTLYGNIDTFRATDSVSQKNAESGRTNGDRIFRFGSPRIQVGPSVDMVRASTEDTKQIDYEACLILNLNTWEWSSVPDLQLTDLQREIGGNKRDMERY